MPVPNTSSFGGQEPGRVTGRRTYLPSRLTVRAAAWVVAGVLRVLTSVILANATANASPNVSLDDPRYEELSAMYSQGILDPYLGGLRPLTEARMDELIGGAGAPPGAWWFAPVDRALVRVLAARDLERTYGSSVRPRDLVGLIAASCEHAEGRPCGPGAGLYTELDSSVGYQDWLSLATRLRAAGGNNTYDEGVTLDRVYLSATLGPLGAEVGRDVIVLGPSARTSLGWGDHAPPLDHLRVSTAEPFELTSSVRASVTYVLGQLRDPQTFKDSLVSIGRGQVDIADHVEIGMMQLLQLGGDGAASLDLFDFITEHIRRGDASASGSDISNRRVGFDVAIRSEAFGGVRFYYQLVFEDWRDRFHHALRHDADHLVGVELAALGRDALVVELQKTGVRSQEHTPRTTGFTNAGRVVGSPLGPDAWSLYLGRRVAMRNLTISPWIELVRFSSDTYTFVVDGPISRATRGTSELRFRGGGRLRRPFAYNLSLEIDAWVELVERLDFEPGVRRENVGAALSWVWRPDFTFQTRATTSRSVRRPLARVTRDRGTGGRADRAD